MTREERLEKDRIRGKIWYAKNRERRLIKIREWNHTHKEQRREIARKWREDNRELVNSYAAKYRERHPDKLKAYKESRKEEIALWFARWYQLNREQKRDDRKQSYKNWAERNPHKICAYAAKRRADLIQRTPAWLTKEDMTNIDSVYKLALSMSSHEGIKYHVDHIIPLKAKNASGLHVPGNLQILVYSENISKNNRYKVKIMNCNFINGKFIYGHMALENSRTTNGLFQLA